MAKKTVATEVAPTTTDQNHRERKFPKATINVAVTLSGTSGLTDEQIAASLGLGPNEDPAVTSASVEKAIRAALATACGSGTMKLRRAQSGNLYASIPLNGAEVVVTAKRAVSKRTDEDKAADAAAFFGLDD